MSVQVAVLEFAGEVDDFLTHCASSGRAPQSYLVVALWPQVQVALKRKGIPYVNTLPYFSNESHRRVVLTSEQWLARAETTAPLTDSEGLSETYSREVAYHLRLYVNYFCWVIELLAEVCRTNRVTALVASASSEARFDGPLIRRDRYLGAIVCAYAAAHGLEFVGLLDGSTPERRSAVGHFARILDRVIARPLAWIQHRRLKQLGSRPAIVVTTLAYNMTPLLERLKRSHQGAAIVLLEAGSEATLPRIRRVRRDRRVDAAVTAVRVPVRDPKLEEGLARLERALESEWATEFVTDGVSFVAVFGAKIRNGLVPWLREIRSVSAGIRSVLQTVRPRLVLSPFAIGPVAAVGEMCRQLEIPGLMIPHGMLAPPRTEIEAIESYRLGCGFVLTTFEYTALQSPWSERYVEAYRDRPCPSVIRTGSLVLSSRRADLRARARQRLFGAAASEAKVLVYATTLKSRASMRLHTHETLDEHLAGIADLVEVVRQTPGVCLLIKLHPARTLAEEQVRELVNGVDHERIAIATTLPFQEALSAADVLVSYSSTCIEEAIQAGVPVLLYDRWARYEHLPSASLDDGPPAVPMPVYYVSNPDRLKDAVRWIAERHVQADIPASELEKHVYPPEVSSNFERFVRQCIDAIPPRPS